MNRIKRILVGIDFSASSFDALSRARQLALHNRAEVEVLSVVDTYALRELHELTSEPFEQMAALALRDQKRRLREFLEDAKIPAGEVEINVAEGNPFMAILQRTRDRGVDLVVLGRQGRGAHVGRQDIGNVAAKCVRKLPTKVMLVAHGYAEAAGRIVACVDMSSNSRVALRQAILVALTERRPLEIVNVYPPPWLRPRSVHDAELQRREHERMAKERLKVFLHGVGGLMNELEVKQHVVEADNSATSINSMLRPQDLVVLGTRGRTAASKEILLGSTAERVIRDTSASVLAIKPEGFDYGGS